MRSDDVERFGRSRRYILMGLLAIVGILGFLRIVHPPQREVSRGDSGESTGRVASRSTISPLLDPSARIATGSTESAERQQKSALDAERRLQLSEHLRLLEAAEVVIGGERTLALAFANFALKLEISRRVRNGQASSFDQEVQALRALAENDSELGRHTNSLLFENR